MGLTQAELKLELAVASSNKRRLTGKAAEVAGMRGTSSSSTF